MLLSSLIRDVMSNIHPEVVNSNQLSHYKEEPLPCQDEDCGQQFKAAYRCTSKLDYDFYDLVVSVAWYYLQNN